MTSQDSVSSTISLLFDSSAELELLAEELEFFALELLAVELELFTLELELLADELEFFALELELFALEQELFALELELLADELEFFALESEFFTLELLSSSPQSMKSRGSESSFGVGLSEQLELKKSTTEYFPYVLFFYGGTDSAFVKNIEKFRKNFTSGLWQDSVARVKSADYLLKNYYMLYELLDDWALKEKLVRQEYDYCYVLRSPLKIHYFSNKSVLKPTFCFFRV